MIHTFEFTFNIDEERNKYYRSFAVLQMAKSITSTICMCSEHENFNGQIPNTHVVILHIYCTIVMQHLCRNGCAKKHLSINKHGKRIDTAVEIVIFLNTFFYMHLHCILEHTFYCTVYWLGKWYTEQWTHASDESKNGIDPCLWMYFFAVRRFYERETLLCATLAGRQ